MTLTPDEARRIGKSPPWDVARGVPPQALELTNAGVDDGDPLAVLDHYTSGYYAVAERRPYWLRDYAEAHGLGSGAATEEG